MLNRRSLLKLFAASPAACAFLPGVAAAREAGVFQNPIAINAGNEASASRRVSVR